MNKERLFLFPCVSINKLEWLAHDDILSNLNLVIEEWWMTLGGLIW